MEVKPVPRLSAQFERPKRQPAPTMRDGYDPLDAGPPYPPKQIDPGHEYGPYIDIFA